MKNLWQKDQPILNGWLSSNSPWNAEILAGLGYHTLTIDAQHGLAADLAHILPMLQAMHGRGALPVVRLPKNDAAFIMRMLDAGVQGLICPMIQTSTEVERFVEATFFPPKGIRSFGPTRAANLFTGGDYFHDSERHIVKMAMIETPESLKNLAKITEVEGLDGLYVGPWDLSISLGYTKHADFTDASFITILKEILAAAIQNGLKVGIHAGSPENALMLHSLGFHFLTILNDSSALKTAGSAAIKTFQNASDTPEASY